MVRNALVAIPQSAKLDDIIIMLNDRNESIPNYMISGIMQGKSVISNLESMESKQGYWFQIKNRDMNKLIMSWMTDTLQVIQ